MRRLFVIVAVVLAFAASGVTAQVAEPGRYELAPGAGGFIRLDTRTGATSHCAPEDGVWRCRPLIEETGALAARIDALSADISQFAVALAELGARVDALSTRLDQSATVATPPPAVERGLVATAMERLFALVRLLKHGRSEAA